MVTSLQKQNRTRILKQRISKTTQNQIDLAVHAKKRDEALRYNRTCLFTVRHLYTVCVQSRLQQQHDNRQEHYLEGQKKDTQNQIDLAVHAHTRDEACICNQTCLLTEKQLYVCLDSPTAAARLQRDNKTCFEIEQETQLTATSEPISQFQ